MAANAEQKSDNYSPQYTTINERKFGYYIPSSYNPSNPTPLLFMFHGMGGNSGEKSGGSAENSYYGWQTSAEKNGFIVLFPESKGFLKTWKLGAGGNSSDLTFVSNLIKWSKENYNINDSQIFTTGHSWGAYFSYYIAKELKNEIAAFAAHSGGLGGNFFLGTTPSVPDVQDFDSKLNAIILHSVDDKIVPFSNSQSLYDDLIQKGHNVYQDGVGINGIIEVKGWGPDKHRYRMEHNQTQWDFFKSVALDSITAANNLTFTGSNPGNGIYNGGSGTDTLKYTSATAGIKIDLLKGIGTSRAKGDESKIGADKIISVENLIAGYYSDLLTGTNGRNNIEALSGNDWIYGALGNDTINGGSGRDTAQFSSRSNRINLGTTRWQNTGDGRDRLISIENVNAGSGNDVVTGNKAANTLNGQNGNDRLYGGGGNDLLIGGGGKDRVWGQGGRDTFRVQRGSGYTIIEDFNNGQDRIQLGTGASGLQLKNRGGDVYLYQRGDLMAVIEDAAGDLQRSGNFLV